MGLRINFIGAEVSGLLSKLLITPTVILTFCTNVFYLLYKCTLFIFCTNAI